jgi:hypothetical protein
MDSENNTLNIPLIPPVEEEEEEKYIPTDNTLPD